ncbi:MAG TPA: carboxypeptidase-like regulatory domain-containing protein, partial [Terriglobales bacterium]|nr:carboxypeptidase-like regulatory domain-containing protein [Terriglobales bacterium]
MCLITALVFGQQRPADSQQTVAASSPANPAQLPSARENKDSDEDQRSHDRVIQGSQRQLPNRRPITTSSIEGLVTNTEARGVGGTRVIIRDASGRIRATMTDADGVFRVADLNAGSYQLELRRQGFQDFIRQNVRIGPREVLTIEVKLQSTEEFMAKGPLDRPLAGAIPPSTAQSDGEARQPYGELRRRPNETVPVEAKAANAQSPPTENENFDTRAYRWDVSNGDRKDPLNAYKRYRASGEYEYTSGHWYDPFNRNKLKGDYPIFGQQTFFVFTGSAVSALDGRRLPTPSLVAARDPGQFEFFGRGGQFFLSQMFRFTGELYHGDASFRPKDWRIVFTPAFDVNYLLTRERGIVNINPQRGTDRFDDHVGLQAVFVEYKIKDLSPNYDFVSVRAGIQQFQSDFRGFIYSEEQPGLRIFGNLKSDKYEYNLAYFYHLEKDTNSGLNTFNDRHQQVAIASLYIQDFLFKGYTNQFSYHFDKDDPTIYYNNNGIITRPEPIGVIVPHGIRSHYIGWASNGHVRRVNVSSAFYQVLGYDTDNQ